MPTEEELEAWMDLVPEEINPKELPNESFSSFYTTAQPNAIFRAFFEYLKKNNVTPKVDSTNWKMDFEFTEDQFGEQLEEDPEFPKRNDIVIDPISVQTEVHLVVDNDAEVETEQCEAEAMAEYYVDFKCTGGSRFIFADFYKQAVKDCLINCHVK